MGRSSSRSKQQVVTTTTTEQKDQKTAGSDNAVVFGPGSVGQGANVVVDQLSDNVLLGFDRVLSALEETGDAALAQVEANRQDVAASRQQQQQMMIYGLIAVVVIAVALGGKKRG